MNFKDYQRLAMRTAKDMGTERDNIGHFATGIASEAGELLTPIKAHLYYGKALDLANLEEELGDILWFVAGLATTVGLTLDEIAERNIAKLQKRYPDKYSDEAAIARADKAPEGVGLTMDCGGGSEDNWRRWIATPLALAPVKPDVLVDVKLRNGSVVRGHAAGKIVWNVVAREPAFDVMAWQPHRRADVSVPKEQVPKIPPSLNGGWLRWNGEENTVPVDNEHTKVDVILRDWEMQIGTPAGAYEWSHTGDDGDIMMYRLHQPCAVPVAGA